MSEPIEVTPPIRYCTRCQVLISPKRVTRGAVFCDKPCRLEDAKERRAYKAGRACRLCGRAARRKASSQGLIIVCEARAQPKGASQQ